MYNLLRCRRGSTALPTVVALVPLIGVLALGAEAGSWYVTKEHAQTAADAAAVAGAWRLAWNASDSVSVAQQFAATNGFCDGCKPLDAPQQVSVVSDSTALSVQVTVSQQQPPYLARVLLGSSPINIAAQATAIVDKTTAEAPCILATNGSVIFQGSASINSQTCGIASNSTASNAITYTGNGSSINAPSYTVGGCSETGGTQCSNNVYTARPQPVTNPLSGLDSAMSSLTASKTNFSGGDINGQCTSLSAYDTGRCYNGSLTVNNGSLTLDGTYFFNGNVKITGGTITAGPDGATLVLFGGATLTISGNPSIQLTAVQNPQVPSALSSVQPLMKDLLIYDNEPYSKQGVNVTGGPNSYFNGIVDVPNTPVTYTGNSSGTAPSPACFEVIAYAVTFSGNTNVDNTKCVRDGTGMLPVPFVRLVAP